MLFLASIPIPWRPRTVPVLACKSFVLTFLTFLASRSSWIFLFLNEIISPLKYLLYFKSISLDFINSISFFNINTSSIMLQNDFDVVLVPNFCMKNFKMPNREILLQVFYALKHFFTHSTQGINAFINISEKLIHPIHKEIVKVSCVFYMFWSHAIWFLINISKLCSYNLVKFCSLCNTISPNWLLHAIRNSGSVNLFKIIKYQCQHLLDLCLEIFKLLWGWCFLFRFTFIDISEKSIKIGSKLPTALYSFLFRSAIFLHNVII